MCENVFTEVKRHRAVAEIYQYHVPAFDDHLMLTIDYRLYDPDGDGHSKLEQVAAMLNSVVYSKQLPLGTVVMDS